MLPELFTTLMLKNMVSTSVGMEQAESAANLYPPAWEVFVTDFMSGEMVIYGCLRE